MTLRLLSSVSLLALAAQLACGPSADDFFHSGAQSYLSNNVEHARKDVDSGPKLFPDDVTFNKLDELLTNQTQDRQQPKEEPGGMTPQQAKQLMDAQKNGEALLPVRPENPNAPRSRV